MSWDLLIPLLLSLAFAGVVYHLMRELIAALRQGYFNYTFVTGWLLRDTAREGQPVLFWFLFALHVIQALVFLGAGLLFAGVAVGTIIEQIAR